MTSTSLRRTVERAHAGRPGPAGIAQNPDVFFQAREAANPFHLAVPGVVADVMDELAAGPAVATASWSTRRADADRAMVLMGSAAGAVEETVDTLVRRGQGRHGPVRLFHPFPVAQLVAALPPTVRSIAVLDRTKEPGAVGEPLYLEVMTALTQAWTSTNRTVLPPAVVGGRYGLSSKEVSPSMIKADLRRARQRHGRSGTSRWASTTT